jgi:proteic killer suppression protein
VQFKTLLGRFFRLELAFSTLSLRTICEDEAQAKNTLGSKVAEVLKRRLADLRAATSVTDLIAGQPRVLDGADKRKMAIDLCDGQRIVFCANHPKNPVGKTGEIDWQKVRRIRILGIDNSHD